MHDRLHQERELHEILFPVHAPGDGLSKMKHLNAQNSFELKRQFANTEPQVSTCPGRFAKHFSQFESTSSYQELDCQQTECAPIQLCIRMSGPDNMSPGYPPDPRTCHPWQYVP